MIHGLRIVPERCLELRHALFVGQSREEYISSNKVEKFEILLRLDNAKLVWLMVDGLWSNTKLKTSNHGYVTDPYIGHWIRLRL